MLAEPGRASTGKFSLRKSERPDGYGSFAIGYQFAQCSNRRNLLILMPEALIGGGGLSATGSRFSKEKTPGPPHPRPPIFHQVKTSAKKNGKNFAGILF